MIVDAWESILIAEKDPKRVVISVKVCIWSPGYVVLCCEVLGLDLWADIVGDVVAEVCSPSCVEGLVVAVVR